MMAPMTSIVPRTKWSAATFVIFFKLRAFRGATRSSTPTASTGREGIQFG